MKGLGLSRSPVYPVIKVCPRPCALCPDRGPRPRPSPSPAFDVSSLFTLHSSPFTLLPWTFDALCLYTMYAIWFSRQLAEETDLALADRGVSDRSGLVRRGLASAEVQVRLVKRGIARRDGPNGVHRAFRPSSRHCRRRRPQYLCRHVRDKQDQQDCA